MNAQQIIEPPQPKYIQPSGIEERWTLLKSYYHEMRILNPGKESFVDALISHFEKRVIPRCRKMEKNNPQDCAWLFSENEARSNK